MNTLPTAVFSRWHANPWPLQEMMLVVSTKGQVVHITHKLANLLGRSRQNLVGLTAPHLVEQLMVQPFAQMHREWMQVCDNRSQGKLCGVQPALSSHSKLYG
jgi:hypothetical protein